MTRKRNIEGEREKTRGSKTKTGGAAANKRGKPRRGRFLIKVISFVSFLFLYDAAWETVCVRKSHIKCQSKEIKCEHWKQNEKILKIMRAEAASR